MYLCAPFDLNDQALIEGARRTGRPAHVAGAIEAAVHGFRERMRRHPPLPIVRGELVLHMIKPRNFFDDYCSAIVLQEICDGTGLGLARVMCPGQKDLKQPMSPDVVFFA